MKCPTCTVDLVMSERQGIEIDYCPTCRGVWLDRGELDKIIERSATFETNTNMPFQQQSYKDHQDRNYHKHHKKHWLGELFD